MKGELTNVLKGELTKGVQRPFSKSGRERRCEREGNEGFQKVESLSMERLMENDKVCCNGEEEVATTTDTSTATKRDDSHTDFRDTTSHFYT